MKNSEIKFRVFGSEYMSNPFTLFDIQEGKIQFASTTAVMQYTGLKDKNEKEIYEGDILSKQGNFSIRIEFNNGFRVMDTDNVRYNNKCIYQHVFDFDFTGWEIIGNIYEHSHLLK